MIFEGYGYEDDFFYFNWSRVFNEINYVDNNIKNEGIIVIVWVVLYNNIIRKIFLRIVLVVVMISDFLFLIEGVENNRVINFFRYKVLDIMFGYDC